MSRPIVFISYCHVDEALKEELVGHLRVLSHDGLLDIWVDDGIEAGGDWEAEIRQAMEVAELAIFLITKDFLNSDFILGTEVPKLLERRLVERLPILPLIARPCAWRDVGWLSRLNVKPKNGSPIWRQNGIYADEELAEISALVVRMLRKKMAVHGNPSRTAMLLEEPETIVVPQGDFLLGRHRAHGALAHEAPQHSVWLNSYRIGKYPITNRQYSEFVNDTGQPPPQPGGWFGSKPPLERLEHPVVGVSWFECLKYCRWLSEKTGQHYRLPTEAEWEKAARGTDGRLFPWGGDRNADRCDWSGTHSHRVTAYPNGQSPYGCFDMVGNVWQWTSTAWGRDWREGQSDFPYPYRPDDGRENLAPVDDLHRIFRGAAAGAEGIELRCSVRRWFAADHSNNRLGFRVVLES